MAAPTVPASPLSFARLFSSHSPTLSPPPGTPSPSFCSISLWLPLLLPLLGSLAIRVQDSPLPSHSTLLNSLVRHSPPPISDLHAIEKWAQQSWNDPNIGRCSFQCEGILFSFPSREAVLADPMLTPSAFKGATLSISRWNHNLGAFLPRHIWHRAFNIPLHVYNPKTYKSIGDAVGGFICVHWKSSESILLLVNSLSPELILEATRLAINGQHFRVSLAWIPALPPSRLHFQATEPLLQSPE
ncbi:hypothetical protein AMTR_s00119p00085950 [Amborella trichopoda]|uniref:Uncharacterized protein n=1 Tax=Amborella trichopoda TaxID=13333 RepID=W1NNC9_AMBTC|nr:hypothetical protein AMTR_s00119p00085950 [Amborella trichopoda]